MLYQLLLIILSMLCSTAHAMQCPIETKEIKRLLEEEETNVIWVQPIGGDIVAVPFAVVAQSKILVPHGTVSIKNSQEEPYPLPRWNKIIAQLFIRIATAITNRTSTDFIEYQDPDELNCASSFDKLRMSGGGPLAGESHEARFLISTHRDI